MSHPLRFSEQAKKDIDHAAHWHRVQRPSLDAEFLSELGEFLNWLTDHPEGPALISRTLRACPSSVFRT